jgi:phosphate transport system ATP-binding protein
MLLPDEPTASLDFRAAAGIEKLLPELKRRCLIPAVSHSPGRAQRLAD